jgi:hypothetical protein
MICQAAGRQSFRKTAVFSNSRSRAQLSRGVVNELMTQEPVHAAARPHTPAAAPPAPAATPTPAVSVGAQTARAQTDFSGVHA